MHIETRVKAISIRLRAFFMAIAAVVLISMVFLTDIFYPNQWNISQQNFAVAFALIYFLTSAFFYWKEYNFIYFSPIKDDKITLKYYSLRPLSAGHHMIEIPRGQFAGYEIQKKFGGLKKFLILKLKRKNQVVSYPPVSITSLSKSEVEKMLAALSKA